MNLVVFINENLSILMQQQVHVLFWRCNILYGSERERRTVRGGKPTSPLCGVLKSDLSFVTFKIVYELEIFTI